MNQETYEQHKQTLAEGKIVESGGRTAASLEELQTLFRIESAAGFGSQSAPNDGEVMAIDSGRLTPEEIEAMGPDHPLLVAAQRLTAPQLDALVDHVTRPLLDELEAKDSTAELPKPQPDDSLTLSDDPREQGVQAQLATGATAAVTPKTNLDNKTASPTPAGKNASKATGDAAEEGEKTGAENAS